MKTKPVELIVVLCACAALLAVFYFTDLAISIALYDPQSAFGRFFEIVGELPNPICGALSGAALLLFWQGKTKGERAARALFGGFMWLFGAILFAFLLLNNLHVFSPFPALAVAAAVAAASLIAARAFRGDRNTLVKVALVGTLLFVTVLIVFNALKITWGRMRFEEMVPPYAGFSAWPFPQHFTMDNAYMSFPSGHASQASVILVITLLPCLYARLANKTALLTVICYAWILPVALSRIVMGAHFASDVVAGFLVTYLLFQLWKRVFLKDVPCAVRTDRTMQRSG